MSEDQNRITSMEVDTAFVKSKRGILKVAEMVRQFAHQQKFEHFSDCNRKELRCVLYSTGGTDRQ